MAKKDITALIERMPKFEERLNVRIDALSAFLSKDEDDTEFDLHARGELYAYSGDELSEDIELTLSVLDRDGRVIEKECCYIDSDKFFGFETFELWCQIDSSKISKIKLVPNKS